MTTNLFKDLEWKLANEIRAKKQKDDLIKQIHDISTKWHIKMKGYELSLKYDKDNCLILNPDQFFSYNRRDYSWYVELKNKDGKCINSIRSTLRDAMNVFDDHLNIIKTGTTMCTNCDGKGTYVNTTTRKRFLRKPTIIEVISTCKHCNGNGKIPIKL